MKMLLGRLLAGLAVLTLAVAPAFASLESSTYINGLVAANPTGADPQSQGDDHIRLLKSTIKSTFPNISGAVTPTHTELNFVDGVTSAIQTQIDTKGAHAGQAWTGTHNFTGATITVPTQSAGNNSTAAASTAFVASSFAPLASPTFTGTPTAPTPLTADDSTKIATTEYVNNVATNAALPSQTGNNGKFLQTDGSNAAWAYTVATQGEAEAGTSSTALTTAQRVKQAIDALAPNEVAIVQDQKSSGTTGALLSSGTWNTREVNTEVFDADGLVTISSNQITINVVGTYEIEAFASVAATGDGTSARTRLYDVSGSAVIAQGESVKLGTDNAENSTATATHVIGMLTVSSTKTIRVETYVGAAGAFGGVPLTAGTSEVYLTVTIRRKAST